MQLRKTLKLPNKARTSVKEGLNVRQQQYLQKSVVEGGMHKLDGNIFQNLLTQKASRGHTTGIIGQAGPKVTEFWAHDPMTL